MVLNGRPQPKLVAEVWRDQPAYKKADPGQPATGAQLAVSHFAK
jgi:hypothetical protein